MSDQVGSPKDLFSDVRAHFQHVYVNVLELTFKLPQGKTNNLHRRKQRHRSDSQ